MTKKISILGSTGSIGVNTLNVIDTLQDKFDVVYLSTFQNIDLIIEQAKKYQPKALAVVNDSNAEDIKTALEKENIEILFGRDGLLEISKRDDLDLVMNGLVGSAGMEPTINSLKAGVDVALSNKESMVMAGDLINNIMNESGAKIYPVDSEHSAIWQCLVGENIEDVKRIILTGSGGPFRTRDLHTFSEISLKEALNHPNWSMGNKITIDSATMMNKGLEVIEARWLFDLQINQIDILIHPQSIIHSMVEFNDRSIKAQLGIPDMKIPIQYALTYPTHVLTEWDELDLAKIGTLTFEEKDIEKFPCIELAYESLRIGGSAPAVLNVANDNAVYSFLNKRIKFTDIPDIIEKACNAHDLIKHPSLEELLELELWTYEFVMKEVDKK
jgi:1-deoxy-D-xylulose-5-phosphate reductoisomerase